MDEVEANPKCITHGLNDVSDLVLETVEES